MGVEVVFGITSSIVIDGGVLLFSAKASVYTHSLTEPPLALARMRSFTPAWASSNRYEPGLFGSGTGRPCGVYLICSVG